MDIMGRFERPVSGSIPDEPATININLIIEKFMKLHDLFDFVISLNEVLDTKIEPKSWENGPNDSLIGKILVDDKTFLIKLEPLTYSFNEKEYLGINVAFTLFKDNKEIEILTYDNRSGSKIIGAIINALETKVNEYNWDFLLFIATNNIEKRMKIYNKIASWKLKGVGGDVITDITINGNNKATVIVKDKSLPMDEFLKFLKTKQKI